MQSMPSFPSGSVVKNPPANAGDTDWIPGSGRYPGEGSGNSFQYSCLGNPVDRGAWWATIHGVAKSQTRLSDFTFTFNGGRRVWIVVGEQWKSSLGWETNVSKGESWVHLMPPRNWVIWWLKWVHCRNEVRGRKGQFWENLDDKLKTVESR